MKFGIISITVSMESLSKAKEPKCRLTMTIMGNIKSEKHDENRAYKDSKNKHQCYGEVWQK